MATEPIKNKCTKARRASVNGSYDIQHHTPITNNQSSLSPPHTHTQNPTILLSGLIWRLRLSLA